MIWLARVPVLILWVLFWCWFIAPWAGAVALVLAVGHFILQDGEATP